MAVRLKAVSPQSPQSPVTFESVKNNALLGVHESVEMLRDLVAQVAQGEDPNTGIKAAQTLVNILVKVADIEVTENLPLLEELKEIAQKKAA